MSASATLGPGRPRSLRLLAWGTYDLGKPRTRILLRGLSHCGADVVECHRVVWRGIEDKTAVRGVCRRLRLLLRWLGSYPLLVVRYLLSPRHDAVLVGYPGALDVLVLWPWARLRGAPIVWDAFIPLYDAVVEDRRLLRPGHPLAKVLLRLERAAARRASRVFLDTKAQAEHFAAAHGVSIRRIGTVPVGVEPGPFAPLDPESDGERVPEEAVATVLFYGQMIPLHGIATVLEAAASSRGRRFRWRIVGEGQEDWRVERATRDRRLARLTWLRWVPYERLRDEIVRADVCLGIFGTTPKAARVVPNKVYQVLAVGKPLVTRDGPAIRELLDEGPGVRLVPPGDPDALVAAVEELAGSCDRFQRWHDGVRPSLHPLTVGRGAIEELAPVLQREVRRSAS